MIVIQNRLSVVVPCYNSEKNIERVIEGAEIIFEKNNIKDYESMLNILENNKINIELFYELLEKYGLK